MDNNLSIIIPTRNRKKYLERSLYYLNQKRCPYQIYIGDSSFNKNILDKKVLKNYKLKINFSKSPFEKNYRDFLKKMLKIIIKVKTKYIYWLCDDDFINIKLLNEGINILNNSKYETFIGRVRNFSIKDINNEWSDLILNDYQYTKLNTSIKKELESAKFINRFKNLRHIQPYEAIVKKKTILQVLNFSIKNNIKNTHDFSLVYKTFVSFAGPIKCKNITLLIRQSNVQNSAGSKLSSSHETNFRDFSVSNLTNLGLKLKKTAKLQFNLTSKDKVLMDYTFENYTRIISEYLIKQFLTYLDIQNNKLIFKILYLIKYYKNKFNNKNKSVEKKINKKKFLSKLHNIF